MTQTRITIAASGLSIKELAKRTGIMRSVLEGAYKGTGRDLTPQEESKVNKVCGVLA